MATQTRTATQTATLTKVVYVTRKVQADLFALVDTYGQMTEAYAQDIIHDLRLLLDEEVLDRIELIWTRSGTNQVVGAFAYKVLGGGIGLADDRSGGIRYDPTLQKSDFGVSIFNNDHWFRLPTAHRELIESKCRLRWGSGGSLDYSRGSWGTERTYSKDGLGLGRNRFTGW